MATKNFHASKPNYVPVTLEWLEPLGSEGKYLQVQNMVLKRTDGTLYRYETLEKASPAVILPITNKGEMILIDQFRYPLMDWELECPAGMPDEGESFRSAAIRELWEEIGYRVGSVIEMGKYASSGGTTNEVARAFLALDCEYEAGSESRERDECIVVNRVPVSRVAAFLAVRRAQGQIINPKMAALVYQYLAEGGGK